MKQLVDKADTTTAMGIPLVPNSPIPFNVKTDTKKEAWLKAHMAAILAFINHLIDTGEIESSEEKTK